MKEIKLRIGFRCVVFGFCKSLSALSTEFLLMDHPKGQRGGGDGRFLSDWIPNIFPRFSKASARPGNEVEPRNKARIKVVYGQTPERRRGIVRTCQENVNQREFEKLSGANFARLRNAA